MPISQTLEAFHLEQSQIARSVFDAGISRDDEAAVWRAAKDEWRIAAAATLTATENLRNIASALLASAGHLAVLRRLLSPPLSQDQLQLRCRAYSKGAEKSGSSISADKADAIAKFILEWRDPQLTPWLDEGREPTTAELSATTEALALLIAAQVAATSKRTLLAAKQEADALALLTAKGWRQKSAPLITQSSQLLAREFMHKTRFATGTSPQEVDIACGLGSSIILAMECKVTNDTTNSIKRVNDILKKTSAWQTHWGSFVRTAALLQGVIAYKDVGRLLEAGVQVFWSHRLEDFSVWLDQNQAK
jgi:hypothetical protein